MSTVMQRQRSRRKLAAVTFLSNISLDGTHRDTNLSCYAQSGNLAKFCQGTYAQSDSNKENEDTVAGFAEEKKSSENNKDKASIIFKEREEVCGREAADMNAQIKTSSQISLNIKEKATTESIRRPTHAKKRSTHPMQTDKTSCFSSSSNESLVTAGGRTRKLSATWSEASAPHTKEPKFVKIKAHPRIKDERLVVVSGSKFPFHIFSTIHHNRASRLDTNARDSGRRRHTSATRPLSTISDSTDPAHLLGLVCFEEALEVSYCDLLVPSRNFCNKPKKHLQDQPATTIEPKDKTALQHMGLARCFSYEPATHKATIHSSHAFQETDELSPLPITQPLYEPNLVDDPELQAGKHRKLLRFPSFMTSSIDYTKGSELKRELNDKFKDKFPQIHLTLSKLRSLKREMLKIARQDCEIDLLTVAQSYAYFEQILLLKNIVNKQTRKLVAGACLILSAKMNDVKGEVLSNLLEKTESVFRLNRKDLLQWEVAVLVALEFGLHLPTNHVVPHYQKLLFES